MSSAIKNKSPFAGRRVILAHHWPFVMQRRSVFFEDIIYLTVYEDNHPAVYNVTVGSNVDMAKAVDRLSAQQWEPDLFIAKVDAFLNIVPRNVAALKCPKVLILGDTHHGKQPLSKMIQYATGEKYDFYITDHKRHHLWFYYLAGIKESYWLPGLFIKPPEPDFQHQSFASVNVSKDMLKGKAVFIGQAKEYHPRRTRLIKKALRQLPYFKAGSMVHSDTLKAYYHADLALNISLNGDLNLRCLEIPAAGGLQIADRLSDEAGLDLLFEEGREIVLFDSEEEMIDKISRLHDDQDQNKNIRTMSNQRYRNEYAPEHMIGCLKDIIEGRTVEERFVSSSLPRIKYIRQAEYSAARIEAYELTQEQHKLKESVCILIDGQPGFAFPEDYLDLPRVKVSLVNQYQESYDRLAQYIAYSPDARRLRSVKAISPAEKYDLIFSSSPQPSLQHNLRDDQSYVVCNRSVTDSADSGLMITSKADL
jgi:hypothetical protein